MKKFTEDQRRKISKSILTEENEPTNIERDNINNSMNTAYSSRVDEDESNRSMFNTLNSELTGYIDEYRNITGFEKPGLHETEYSYEAPTEMEDSESLNPATATYETKTYRDSYKLQEVAKLETSNAFFDDISRTNNNPDPKRPSRYDIQGISVLNEVAEFDGESSYIQISDAVEIQNIFNDGGSISAWIYPYSSGENGNGRIIDKTGFTVYTTIESGDNCDIVFRKYFNGDNGTWRTTNRNITLNEWNHIIITYNNNSISNDPIFYINNEVIALSESSTPTETYSSDIGNDLYIGNMAANNRTFDGLISEVKLFNKILTAKERELLYNKKEIISVPYYWPDNTNLLAYWPAENSYGVATDDLISYYEFEENATDSAGSNDGNATGITYVNGIASKAANFNGTSSYINCGDVSEFTFDNDFAISFWFRADTIDSNQRGLVWRWGASAHEYYISLYTNNKIRFEIEVGGSDSGLSGDTTIQEDTWYFVTCLYDGANQRIYLNNNLDGEITGLSGTLTEYTHNLILGSFNGSAQYFDGLIDEVRLYNRTLSEAEIIALYEKPGPQNYSTNLIDYSGNGNNGTISGASFVNGIAGHGLNFDGTNHISLSQAIVLEGQWSVSYWFNQFSDAKMTLGENETGENRIYHTSAASGIRMHFDDNNSVDLATGNQTGNGWKHLVIIANDLEISAYLDGEFIETSTKSGTGNTFYIDNIGKPYSSSSYNWYGQLDEIRIYNRILTASEIKSLYRQKSILNTDLKAYYKLNNTANDFSLYFNNGSENDILYRDGFKRDFISSKSIHFTGTNNSYAYKSDGLLNSESSFTYSLWLKPKDENWIPDGSTAGGVILTDKGRVYLEYNIDSRPGLVIRMYDNAQHYASSSITLYENTWYHIVGTFNGEYIYLYVNGKEVDREIGNWEELSYDFVIGASRDYTNLINADIDDLRVYTRALSAEEVYELYNFREPNTNNLIAHYYFNGNGNDSSGNNNHLVTNNVLWQNGVSPSPFEYPYSPTENELSSSFLNIRDYYDNGGSGGNIPDATILGSYEVLEEDEIEENQSYMTVGSDYDSEIEENMVAEYVIEDLGVNTNNLIGYYEFENDATDSSASSNNGTATNVSYVTGIIGKGAYFDGSADVTISGVTPPFASRGNWTISLWMKAKSTDNNYSDVISYYVDTDNRFNIYNYSNEESLRIVIKDAATEIILKSYTSAPCYNDNINHLAVTCDNANLRVYFNGILIDTDDIGDYTLTGGSYLIGDGNSNLVGWLDEVRVYSRTLSETEIIALYNDYEYQSFSSTLSDSSSNSNDGTITGSSLVYNKGRKSLFFDGIDDYVQVSDHSSIQNIFDSGTTAPDSSGNGNNGTISGAICRTDNTTVSSGCMEFDGSTSYIQVSDDASIQNIFDGGGAISCWIYPKSDGENNVGRIIHKQTGAAGYIYYVSSESGGVCKVWFIKYFNGDNGTWSTTDRDITLNAWNHLVIIYDDNSISNDPTIYVNGSSVAVTANTIPTGAADSDVGVNMYIGGQGADNVFDGYIDEVRVYTRALSAEEVYELYSRPVNNSVTSNLVARYSFDTLGGTISAWIYPKSDGENNAGRILDKRPSGDNGWAWYVFSDDGSNCQIGFVQAFDGGSSGNWRSTSREVTLNAWNYITLNYNSDSINNNPIIYVNNSSVALTEHSTPVGTRDSDIGQDLYIGNQDTGTYTFDGYISNIKLFDSKLSEEEVNLLYKNYTNTFFMENFEFNNNYILINPNDENNFAFGKIIKSKQEPARILFTPFAKKGTIPENASYTKTFIKNDPILLTVLEEAVNTYENKLLLIKEYLQNNPNREKEYNKKYLSDLNVLLDAFTDWKNETDPTSSAAINTLLESIENRQNRFLSRKYFIENNLLYRENDYADRLDIIAWRINKLDGTLKAVMDTTLGRAESLKVYDRKSERQTWYDAYFVVRKLQEDGQYKRRIFIEDPDGSISKGDWVYILSDDETVPEIYAKVDLVVDGRLTSYEDSDLDLENGDVNVTHKEMQKIFLKNVVVTGDYKKEDLARLLKQIQ